ncbi:MAG TPA: hypothetical protein VGD80_40105 [Kofleriaceae bacterium]
MVTDGAQHGGKRRRVLLAEPGQPQYQLAHIGIAERTHVYRVEPRALREGIAAGDEQSSTASNLDQVGQVPRQVRVEERRAGGRQILLEVVEHEQQLLFDERPRQKMKPALVPEVRIGQLLSQGLQLTRRAVAQGVSHRLGDRAEIPRPEVR